jgi:hypothetical protein
MNLPAFSGLRLKSPDRARRLRRIQVDWPFTPMARSHGLRGALPHRTGHASTVSWRQLTPINCFRTRLYLPKYGLAEKAAASFVRQLFIRNESSTEHRARDKTDDR